MALPRKKTIFDYRSHILNKIIRLSQQPESLELSHAVSAKTALMGGIKHFSLSGGSGRGRSSRCVRSGYHILAMVELEKGEVRLPTLHVLIYILSERLGRFDVDLHYTAH